MAISKITSKSIADGTVVGADITPGTVTNAKISPSAAIANSKLQNSSITVSGTSVTLGGSGTINTAIDWQSVVVADGSTTLNAVAGKGYFLDTNTGVIEVFLPSSPSRGDRIILADYAGHFDQNQIIINTGGNLIDSSTGPDFKVTTKDAIVELIYVDSNKGWLVYLNQTAGATPSGVMNAAGGYDTVLPAYYAATGGTVTTSGDHKIHVFTGDGCFVVSSAGNCAGSGFIDYVVQAGGGGGGKGASAGGAGGLRHSATTYTAYPVTAPFDAPQGLELSAATYPITVGAGGAGMQPNQASFTTGPLATRGSNSVFSTITSAGGGAAHFAGPNLSKPNQLPATPGGSGASGIPSGDISSFGIGNTPPVSPPQGFSSGPTGTPNPEAGANPDQGPEFSSRDGGGAGAGSNSNRQGTGGTTGNAGRGFPAAAILVGCTGVTHSPVPTDTRFIGGGGGGGGHANPSCFTTAIHGGGNGGGAQPGNPGAATNASAGSANTGGGGGGGGAGGGRSTAAPQGGGGAGGKGLVIIRYKFQN